MQQNPLYSSQSHTEPDKPCVCSPRCARTEGTAILTNYHKNLLHSTRFDFVMRNPTKQE